MDAIPIEESLLRPIGSLGICAFVPLLTARVLWRALVGQSLEGDASEQARALAPFHTAEFLVGLVQIQLAWLIGATALGPRWTDSRDAIAGNAWGALCAIVAFCAGGLARLLEEPERSWRLVRATIALRLRLVPLVAGPVIAASLASRLAVVDENRAVRLGVVAIALAVVVFGTAFGGTVARVLAQRLARRMAGATALADALVKLLEDARMPLVTGPRRVHPGLYDRLVACGRDPGPRPSPPHRRAGMIAGLAVSAALVGVIAFVEVITRIDESSVPFAGADAARRRLRVDPWDSTAMLAFAWAARGEEDLELAAHRAELAERIGAPSSRVLELEAEVLAARNECGRARAAFDAALAARAREAFDAPWEPLELGGWQLPPTLVRECGYGARPTPP